MSIRKTFQQVSPEIRKNLVVIFLAGVLFWTSMASQLPTIPLYVRSIGGTPEQVGTVMGAFAIGLLTFRSWMGKFADQNGRRRVVQLGLLVAAIVPVFYAMLPPLPIMFGLRAIHGVCIAAFTTGVSALISDLAPPQHRGEIIGYMTLVNPLGLSLGPLLSIWIGAEYGYRGIFIAAAILAATGLAITIDLQEAESFLKAKMLDRINLAEQAAQNELSDRPGNIDRIDRLDRQLLPQISFWQLLSSDRVRIPTITLFMCGAMFGTLASFLPLLIEDRGLAMSAGLFYTVVALASFMSRLQVANTVDRYGRGLFITVGLICYALSMLCLFISSHSILVILAAIMQGAGSGIVLPTIIALLADRSTIKERGSVFGAAWIGFDLGIAAAGPVIGGLVRNVAINNAFSIAACLGIVAILLFATQSNHSLTDSFRFAIGRGKDKYAVPS
ncbi:major facilitator superfamily MFS_1 [Thalassoporum mexicanum PCC 7367]|uniref:MFS transporter n=1 Tax=Thalassoporum mexicanum TaxID=3457544 RepID=UPI00029FE6FB|nr:MFS transporter [Pseudanabaena sp. PCC 7367]AFY71588.1 major facilitator superfamily MFS_1 [Pseudanabaena sp. PCC 7367]